LTTFLELIFGSGEGAGVPPSLAIFIAAAAANPSATTCAAVSGGFSFHET